jgi:hypothetical protein
MMTSAWTARQLQARSVQIQHLKAQVKAHQTNLHHTHEKIQSLSNQFAEALQAERDINLLTEPAYRLFRELLQNRSRDPNARRYSRDTTIWARKIYDISQSAWEVVRKVLPLPSNRVLKSAFAQVGCTVSQAPLDINEVGTILDLWTRSSPGIGFNTEIVISVDTVAFRPMIVIHEGGTIEGLNRTNETAVNLFDKLMGQPQAFAAFLKQHGADAYSALFVFQIQSIDPSFHHSVNHIFRAVHGKGNLEIVSQLFELKDTLQKRFTLAVCDLAFDGDSCFNAIHRDFYRIWIQQMRDDVPSSPLLISDPGYPPIISDPLHLLKRIRCRWVSRNFSTGLGQERVFFSTDRIRKVGFLSPIVFLESQASKMHDSFPIHLFFPLTFLVI